MDLTLHRLVEFAIQAPSGENAQPWRFVSKRTNEIEVHVETSRDQSPYSWGHRSAYVAIGAAIENMKVGAPSLGKSLAIELFPEIGNGELVARLKVIDATSESHPLFDSMGKRVTNRKPYEKYLLTTREKETLTNCVPAEYPPLTLTVDPEVMKLIAKAGSTNERVMLGNPSLHEYFFGHVNWTEEEDFTRKEGFFIKSLELPPPAMLGFKAMSSWRRANILNRYLHFNELVQSQNAAIYAGSSAMGAISTQEDSPKAAVLSGMAMERVWLTATSLGLAFQPIAGLMFLKLGIDNNHSNSFDDSEKSLIKEAYETLQSAFNIKSRQIYFVFRTGRAAPPSAKARRYTVEDVTSINT